MIIPRQEAIIITVLLVLLGLLFNPFHFWMPGVAEVAVIACLVVVFGLFVALIWREAPRDEREAIHQLRAGRFGFIAGASTIMAGIVVQSLTYMLDPWLLASLGAMVIAKALSFIYSSTRN